MFNICCTSKLLKRIDVTPEVDLVEPTTALGNWYATIHHFSRTQALLFVSDTSRLAVVTPAREARLLARHLREGLAALLESLCMPSAWIESELSEMVEVRISTTHSRSILATMNDFKYQIMGGYFDDGWIDPLEVEGRLSECPIGPFQWRTPGEVAADLLKARYESG